MAPSATNFGKRITGQNERNDIKNVGMPWEVWRHMSGNISAVGVGCKSRIEMHSYISKVDSRYQDVYQRL